MRLSKREKAAKEAERAKKVLAELGSRQKQIEDRMTANYDRLYGEVMRLIADRLASIKDERECQQEINMLGMVGVEALDEMERHQEQEEAEAKARLLQEEDHIDYVTELEIAAEK
jgi:hypothetical protein